MQYIKALYLNKQSKIYPVLLQECFIALVVLSLWFVALYAISDNATTLVDKHWPIILIAFIAATFANATAVGGGFIFVPLFSIYYGISSIEALKLALSTQAFGMTSGALNWPSKLFLWPYLFVACFSSGIGMWLGTYYFSPESQLLNPAFGTVSVLLGIALLIESAALKRSHQSPRPITKAQLSLFFLICLGGGFINAWVSIGIGEIVALWLFLVCRHTIGQAVTTGVGALAFCSILGFIFHADIGGIPWHYLAFTVPGVIIGGRVGAKLGTVLSNVTAGNNSGLFLKILIAIVILADGVFVLLYK